MWSDNYDYEDYEFYGDIDKLGYETKVKLDCILEWNVSLLFELY
jgi:hypothetical protein